MPSDLVFVPPARRLPMRERSTLWIVIATTVLFGACGDPEGSASPILQPTVECVGVPETPCDEAVASLAGSLAAPAVQISVTCVVEVCTDTDGQLQIDVVLADGRRESRGSGYGTAQPQPVPAAPPVLTVAPICLGVPFAECREMALSAAGSGGVGGGPPIARITVRCIGVCTRTKGEGETRIDYVDGTNQVSGWGYESVGG